MLNALCNRPERLRKTHPFVFERSRPERVIGGQQVEIGLEAEICFSAHALCLTGYLSPLHAALTCPDLFPARRRDARLNFPQVRSEEAWL